MDAVFQLRRLHRVQPERRSGILRAVERFKARQISGLDDVGKFAQRAFYLLAIVEETAPGRINVYDCTGPNGTQQGERDKTPIDNSVTDRHLASSQLP